MSIDPEKLSDDQLVVLCRRRGIGDDRPWAELYRRHRQLVWSVCRRYFRNREDVADMVQETFLRALRNLGSFRGGHSGQLPSWLVTVANNICRNELRRRSRRHQPSEDEITPEMAISLTQAAQELDASRSRARLRAAMLRLSEREREILQLAEFEELSYTEISSRLEISSSAVKMRVLRARASLAAAFHFLDGEGSARKP